MVSRDMSIGFQVLYSTNRSQVMRQVFCAWMQNF